MLDACSGKLTHKYCMTWVRSYIFSQYVITSDHIICGEVLLVVKGMGWDHLKQAPLIFAQVHAV